MIPRAVLVAASLLVPALGAAQPAPPAAPSDMERAQRAADGPRRFVLEMGKLSARAAKPAERPAPKPAVPALQVPAVRGAELAPVAVDVPAAAEEPAPAVAVDDEVLSAAAPVAARLGPTLAETLPAPLPDPKLVDMVEPTVPRHLLPPMRGPVEAVVTLTIRADGSVAVNVAVASSTLPALDPSIVDAVRQWRYAPAGAARGHAVQIVLRP